MAVGRASAVVMGWTSQSLYLSLSLSLLPSRPLPSPPTLPTLPSLPPLPDKEFGLVKLAGWFAIHQRGKQIVNGVRLAVGEKKQLFRSVLPFSHLNSTSILSLPQLSH